MRQIKFSYQLDESDCGPACIRMIASFWGIDIHPSDIKNSVYVQKNGMSLLGIQEVVKQFGFQSSALLLTVQDLINNKFAFPCILHWQEDHYVVLNKISRNILTSKSKFHIVDPAHGNIKLSQKDFEKFWIYDNCCGVAMFFKLDKTLETISKKHISKSDSIKTLLSYLTPYKGRLLLMFTMLILGSLLNLLLPYLTQYLIDDGIGGGNINIIIMVLIAQLAIFIGILIFEVIRNWIMLYVGTRISIKIVSDFLKNILRLPIRFFENKMIGDFNQRIDDNERIEEFLTSQGLQTVFSFVSLCVLLVVMLNIAPLILLLFLSLTILSILWSNIWLHRRNFLDYFRFLYRGQTQNTLYEIFDGISEMKVNDFEEYKRKEWENVQQNLFTLNIKSLKINQIQLLGFDFFNQIKNILVTFLSAMFVIEGKITLGELMSISYIIGLMNSPINQLVLFSRSLQDAKLSFTRINEINQYSEDLSLQKGESIGLLKNGIRLNNVSYQYEGKMSPYALKNINLNIEIGKITAIVGASGSGKSTLLKLLLKFYAPTDGEIYYGDKSLTDISEKALWKESGIVMQNCFIFSDTVARNIAMGDEFIDMEKLETSCKIANLEEFIDMLPLKFKTKIGMSGNGISGGERQRIAIARAIYKNPNFLFFDEATNALDADNESIIVNNLQKFYTGRTVVIVAHRLSTVKNADKIVVLDKGMIAEEGSHDELINMHGKYFSLVRNQL